MDEYYNKHYITVDDAGSILSGWSDGPHPDRDTTGAVLLTDKGGYQFRLWPDGEENPMLADLDGIPLYKMEDGYPVHRTDEELEADREALLIPTAVEQIAALKEELDATDYKIIKCSEYQLAGLEMPYDMAALHAERQAIRDRINALEAGQEVSANE